MTMPPALFTTNHSAFTVLAKCALVLTVKIPDSGAVQQFNRAILFTQSVFM